MTATRPYRTSSRPAAAAGCSAAPAAAAAGVVPRIMADPAEAIFIGVLSPDGPQTWTAAHCHRPAPRPLIDPSRTMVARRPLANLSACSRTAGLPGKSRRQSSGLPAVTSAPRSGALWSPWVHQASPVTSSADRRPSWRAPACWMAAGSGRRGLGGCRPGTGRSPGGSARDGGPPWPFLAAPSSTSGSKGLTFPCLGPSCSRVPWCAMFLPVVAVDAGHRSWDHGVMPGGKPPGSPAPVEARLFGPVEVGAGPHRLGPGDFGGIKAKQVVELLLAARGHGVPKDRLVDRLWGEDPPRHPLAALENHVSTLRRHLSPQ